MHWAAHHERESDCCVYSQSCRLLSNYPAWSWTGVQTRRKEIRAHLRVLFKFIPKCCIHRPRLHRTLVSQTAFKRRGCPSAMMCTVFAVPFHLLRTQIALLVRSHTRPVWLLTQSDGVRPSSTKDPGTNPMRFSLSRRGQMSALPTVKLKSSSSRTPTALPDVLSTTLISLKESAEVFPPLQSAVAGVIAVWDIAKVHPIALYEAPSYHDRSSVRSSPRPTRPISYSEQKKSSTSSSTLCQTSRRSHSRCFLVSSISRRFSTRSMARWK
ncbi:hypothetical protein DFH06DRAFT_160066 [Mycena polygramma]|nr:hypothetical protein DFH06DRAFT_160066 [Mycena polygramma]